MDLKDTMKLFKLSIIYYGNSSSGIIEAPYFNKTVINIGSRQSGRNKDNLIKDIEADSDKVINELKKGFSINWRTGKGGSIYGKR